MSRDEPVMKSVHCSLCSVAIASQLHKAEYSCQPFSLDCNIFHTRWEIFCLACQSLGMLASCTSSTIAKWQHTWDIYTVRIRISKSAGHWLLERLMGAIAFQPKPLMPRIWKLREVLLSGSSLPSDEDVSPSYAVIERIVLQLLLCSFVWQLLCAAIYIYTGRSIGTVLVKRKMFCYLVF